MPETIYYADSAIRVTSEWVRLGEKIYPVAEIKSVKVKCAQPKSMRELPYFLMIAGSITAFTLLNVQHLFPSNLESALPSMLTLSMVVGITGLLLLVARLLLRPECIYVIKLHGSFGEVSPFASDDEQYVNKVANFIKASVSAAASRAHTSEGSEAMRSPVTLDIQT